MENNYMLTDKIIKMLDDKKVIDIKMFDVSSYKNRMSETCIIASGTSSRHMQAVADFIYKQLKSDGYHPYIEGNAKSGWVLIETDSIEIHLFKPELREYYNIEELLKFGSPRNSEDIMLGKQSPLLV